MRAALFYAIEVHLYHTSSVWNSLSKNGDLDFDKVCELTALHRYNVASPKLVAKLQDI